MLNQFSRTELLLGESSTERLFARTVAVFGMGGVGSYAVEALARAGIGHFILVDSDVVDVTNINRQLIATHETLGMPKVLAARDRIHSINPLAKVDTHQVFLVEATRSEIDLSSCDYVIDCIDTVLAKIILAEETAGLGIPLISSMGTGNKLDPTRLEIADISKTSVCPLARVMRRELKKRGIKKLKVVYSREEPRRPSVNAEMSKEGSRKPVPGSVSFVPSVAGLILAGEVIKDILRV
jgi:tRNA threonylcarbamoyladenosine dehydratase